MHRETEKENLEETKGKSDNVNLSKRPLTASKLSAELPFSTFNFWNFSGLRVSSCKSLYISMPPDRETAAEGESIFPKSKFDRKRNKEYQQRWSTPGWWTGCKQTYLQMHCWAARCCWFWSRYDISFCRLIGLVMAKQFSARNLVPGRLTHFWTGKQW